MIFPFSHAAQIEAQNENEEPSFYSQLLAGGVNGNAADFDLLNDVTAYLTEVNQYQIECGISNSYLQFEKEYASLQWLTGYWVWIGAATMLMVATGMIGTLLLFQYRRRKNTAVSYFCGSTKRRIYAEQLVEIGAVLLFGTGNRACYWICSDPSGCIFLSDGDRMVLCCDCDSGRAGGCYEPGADGAVLSV